MIRTLLVFIALLGFALSHARADEPLVNLATDREADRFAREYVAQLETEAKTKNVEVKDLDPVVILHVGNQIPKHLKWIMLHFQAAHVPFEFEQVTEKEMHEKLDVVSIQNEKYYRISYDGSAAEAHNNRPLLSNGVVAGVTEIVSDSDLFLRKLFGMPRGLTAWLRFRELNKLRPAHAALATASSLVAGPTVAFTFYLDPSTASAEYAPLRAGVALAMLTWVYVYNSPYFSEIMSLMKVVKKDEHGTTVATDSRTGKLISNTARSLIFNAVVTAATFGFDALFSGFRFGTSITNTLIHIFARIPIDDALRNRAPTINNDGTVKVEKGQWNLKTWLAVDALITTVYTIPKVLHLLDIAPAANYIYYTMGALGLMKVVYSERHNIKDRILRIKEVVHGFNVEYCETAFVRKRIY